VRQLRTLLSANLIWLCCLPCTAKNQDGSIDRRWLTSEWSAKDPYASLRKEVDTGYAKAADKVKWVKGLEAHRYEDARARFRFILGVYLARSDKPDYPVKKAEEACRGFLVPESYEAVRARFLITAYFQYDGDMLSLGKRLLAHKEDFDVRYMTARVMVQWMGRSKESYDSALKMGKELVERYPDTAKGYTILGAIYRDGYFYLKIKSDRAKALEWYRKYLASNPPPSFVVQDVKMLIKELESARE
jgi:tetratricopeptide (TPR) repeat protein